ncbi:MAG TPA: hypothetical protein VM451_09140 [Candidatus Limnocylindria bacterium]|nr:hypothetical protein [Candidatus Limnocylindria bacterium]
MTVGSLALLGRYFSLAEPLLAGGLVVLGAVIILFGLFSRPRSPGS